MTLPVDKEEYFAGLDALSTEADVVALYGQVLGLLKLLGVGKAYFLAPLTSDPRIGRVVTSFGLPSVWERNYRRALFRFDPLPNHCLRQSGPIFWSPSVNLGKLTRFERRYLLLSERYGLDQIIGVACFGPHGRSGYLGVIWPHSEPPCTATMHMVMSIANASFRRYCFLVKELIEPPNLSRRELEVLSWMCTGTSNVAIAEALGIASSSVDVYVRRIFAKLEVNDRTAACLRAYSLGLTVPGEHYGLVRKADILPGRTDAERLAQDPVSTNHVT